MADPESVQQAIEAKWNDELSDIITVYTNLDSTAQSNGEVPWVKQTVRFNEAKQFELGNIDSARHWGALVFIIYVRRGLGSADRVRIYNRVVNSFRSKQTGGATFLNVQPLISGSNNNWSMSGYQIPFYFNSI